MLKSAPIGVYPVASIAALAGLWFVAAAIFQSPLLPAPNTVLQFIVTELTDGDMLYQLTMTLWRVAAAFTIAMLIGCAIGLLMGRSRLANDLLDPWLIVFLNIPALVVIILAYVWAGLTEVAAITAVAINKIPNVAVTAREGAKALDRDLDEMASAYRMRTYERLRHVTLPQLQPYVAAAARSGIALIWKIVLVVELLGRSNGVGFQLHLYFQLFDVTGILGYTIVFASIILLIEILIVQPFERHATRWRLRPT